MKRLGSVLLILLMLVPAISSRDDEIGLADLLGNSNPHDDRVASLSHQRPAIDDGALRVLLRSLEDAQVRPIYVLSIQDSSATLAPGATGFSHVPTISSPVGRSPPAI